MKDNLIALLVAAAFALVSVSCLQMPAAMLQPNTPGNLTQVGGKIELTTAHGSLKSDMSVSFRDATKAVSGSIRDWLIAKVLLRGLDSMDATTASDEALAKAEIDGKIAADKIAADQKIALEKLALEAAEAPVP